MPLMELPSCPDLAVPANVMHHVVHVESSFNPYAIGVVGGHLVRQPRNLPEAVATARMLESRGVNFSLGLAQVNRYNLARYGLANYQSAFAQCPNLAAGSHILADCQSRAGGDWGKAFSCYYSGNFETGYRQGYVQKIFASMRNAVADSDGAIPLASAPVRLRSPARPVRTQPPPAAWSRRIVTADSPGNDPAALDATPAAGHQQQPAQASELVGAQPDAPVLLEAHGAPRRALPAALTPTQLPAPARPPVDSAFVF